MVSDYGKSSKIPTSGSWYLASWLTMLEASTLVACGKPEEIGALSGYVQSQLDQGDATERKLVSKRLRDVLMKEWTLVGIPLVITAVTALAKAEEGSDFDDGLSEQWWVNTQGGSFSYARIQFLAIENLLSGSSTSQKIGLGLCLDANLFSHCQGCIHRRPGP